jgi:hypothetical protein
MTESALALLLTVSSAHASMFEIYYAPVENLERIDRALIASAKERIDMAAYTP